MTEHEVPGGPAPRTETGSPAAEAGEPSGSDEGPAGLVRSSAVMAAGTILSRLTGFARVLLTAWVLGSGTLGDVYNLTNSAPNQLYELLLGGVLTSVLVPLIVEQLIKNEPKKAWREISNLFWMGLVFGVVGSLLLAAVAPFLIDLTGQRFHGDAHTLAVRMVQLLAIEIFFYAMTALANAVLNARRHFAVPAFAPVLNNLVVIGVLVCFVLLGGRPTIALSVPLVLLLGLGTAAGIAAMALVTLPTLRSVTHRSGGNLRPVLDFRSPVLRRLLRLSTWTIGYVAVNQIGLLVVQSLANSHSSHPGDFTAWTNAFIFFQLPNGVFAVSVLTVLLPQMSAFLARDNLDGFRSTLTRGVRLIAFLTLPTMVLILFLAGPMILGTLAYRSYSLEVAHVTSVLLQFFALGLIPFTTFMLVLRSFYSMQDTRTPFLVNIAATASAIVLDVTLYPLLRVYGLTIAYSFSYVVASVLGWYLLSRKAHGLHTGRIGRSVARVAAACVPLAAVLWVARLIFGTGSRGLVALAEVVVGSLVGIGVFLVAAKFVGVEELGQFRRLLTRRNGQDEATTADEPVP